MADFQISGVAPGSEVGGTTSEEGFLQGRKVQQRVSAKLEVIETIVTSLERKNRLRFDSNTFIVEADDKILAESDERHAVSRLLDFIERTMRSAEKTGNAKEDLRRIDQALQSLHKNRWFRKVVRKDPVMTSRIDRLIMCIAVSKGVNPVSEGAMAYKELEQRLGIQSAKEIKAWFSAHFHELVASSAATPTLLSERSVKHLKTYVEPNSQQVVVDVTLGELSRGVSKCAKDGLRVLLTGATVLFVRLGPIDKTAEGMRVFEADIANELLWRAKLEGVPWVTKITVLSYEKGGKVVKRYFMDKFDGNLHDLLFDRPTAPKKPLLDPGKMQEALHCCSDVLETLIEMHKRGIVHCDIKPENIFLKGGHGWLSDFGLSRAAGSPGLLVGSLGFCAPEIIDAFVKERELIYTPEIDMWAFGMLLLLIEKPFLFVRIQHAQARVLQGVATLEELHRELKGVRSAVAKSKDSTAALISGLLDPNSETRLTAEVAYRAFRQAL